MHLPSEMEPPARLMRDSTRSENAGAASALAGVTKALRNASGRRLRSIYALERVPSPADTISDVVTLTAEATHHPHAQSPCTR